MSDGGFANPDVITSGSYVSNPTGTPWTFSGRSGIEADGSIWSAPAAPDGDGRAAYIQGYDGTNGAISQSIYLSAGTYSLTFDAAQRSGYSANPIQVSVDGIDVGDAISPASASTWTAYTTDSFTISTAGDHTIQFAGTVDDGDDDTFIDAIGGAAPSGLGAYASDGQVALAWSPVSGATSYNIYRSTTAGGEGTTPYASGITSTTYTDTSVTDNTTYYYTATAVGSGGESPQSAELAVKPNDAGITDADIGGPGVSGTASLNDGVFTMTGGGSDIWNNSDQFNFDYAPVSQNTTLITQISSQTDSDGWAKAGLMFRDSSAADAAEFDIVTTPGNGIIEQWRSGDNNSTNLNNTLSGSAVVPSWLQVVYNGGSFTAYYSTQSTSIVGDVTWTQLGSTETIAMSRPIAGLAVTSHNNSTLSTATFAHFTIDGSTPNQAVPPPTDLATVASNEQVSLSWAAVGDASSYNVYRSTVPGGEGSTPYASGVTSTTYTDASVTNDSTYYYTVTAMVGGQESAQSTEAAATPNDLSLTDADIGGPGLAGSASYNGDDDFTINGSGSDIWNNSDQFNFEYSPVTGNVGIRAEVTSQTDTDSWAKAGVMIRNDSTAGAAYAAIFATPGNGIDFQWRSSAGSDTNQYTAYGIHVPAWVRLDRSGNNFSGYYSINGTSWTQVGTATATLSTSAIAGMVVTAHNNSSLSTATFSALAFTEAPSNLTATGGNEDVSLSWSAVSGASSYNIYRSTTSGGEGSTPYLTGLTTTSYSDTGLSTDSSYYYTVTAVENGVESPQSGEASATTDLDGPATISAVGADGEIQIAWAPVTGATSYDLYRGSTSGAEGGTPYATGITNAFYTDTSLAPSSTEYYTVTAITPQGQSLPSAETSATTDSLPDAPTSLTATADSGGITLSWTPSPNALAYNIYRGTSSGGESSTAIYSGDEAAQFTDTTALPDTTYYYRVTSVDAAGEGAASNEASALTVPGTPTITTASAGDTIIYLAWTPVPGATSYNLYQGTGPGGEGGTPYQTGITTAAYGDTGLDDGTTYYYTVTAVNSSGEGIASAEASATPVALPPTVATAAAASLSSDGTTVTLSTLGADAGGESNLSYNWTAVTPDGVDDPFFSDSSDNTAKDCTATLFGAGDYTFTCTVTNGNQLTATTSVSLNVSAIESGVYVTAPSPAIAFGQTEAFTAVAVDQFGNSMATQPDFTWSVASGGAGGTINSSGNYTAPSASASYDTITATTDDSAAVAGSATIMPNTTGTAAPGDVYASPADGEVDLSWDADPNAASYKVFRGSTSGSESSTPIATVTTATYADTGLTDGTRYYYTVVAVNSLGTGATSAEASATPAATPAAPSGLSASAVSSNEIDLSWTDNSGGSAGFVIERSDDGGATFTVLDTVDPGTTTYQDTSVSDGVTEVYEVAAYNTTAPAAQSTFSSAATAATPLAAPDTLDAEAASESEIDLSWINESQVATSFTIYRAIGTGTYSAVTTITNPTTTTFADTGLSSGTTYSYEVQANEGTITSATSTTVTATTDLASPTGLTVVDSLVGSATGAIVDLSWTGVTGATGYAVERTGGPGGGNWSIIGGGGGTTYRDDLTVLQGTTYSYRVTAYDDSDRSDPSSIVSTTTPIVAPAAPDFQFGEALDNTDVFLAWNNNATNVAYWQVQRWSGVTNTWATVPSASHLPATQTYYIDTSATAGADNLYNIVVYNSSGQQANAVIPGGVQTPNNQPGGYGSGTPTVGLSYVNPGMNAVGPDGNPQPAWIIVSRSGNLNGLTTANFDISGDGVFQTDYALNAIQATGSSSNGSLAVTSSDSGMDASVNFTFQPGETYGVIESIPLNETPRSGKQLNFALQAVSGYSPYLPGQFSEMIAPHGLAIKLDQGEQYPIITQPMTSTTSTVGLMQLTLAVPQDLPVGSTVTLGDNEPGETVVYQLEDGTLVPLTTSGVGVYSWIYDPAAFPTTLYVGAVQGFGSVTVGDTLFQLLTMPLSSTTHPNNTTQTATTKPSSDVTLTISLANDPNLTNSGKVAMDTQAHPLPWLVGQVASLTANYTGPGSLVDGGRMTWHADGNVAKTINPNPATSSSFQTRPFGRNLALTVPEQFFWITIPGYTLNAAAAQSAVEDVTVAVHGVPGAKKAPQDLVKFQVYAPNAATSVNPQPLSPPALADVTVGRKPAKEVTTTINFSANVSTPLLNQTFASGKFFYLQTIDSARQETSMSGTTHYAQVPWEYVRDVDYPYASHDSGNPTPASGWPTDSGAKQVGDGPRLVVWRDGSPIFNSINSAEAFHMFLMYVPPGVQVEPVPLGLAWWWYSAVGQWNKTKNQFMLFGSFAGDAPNFAVVNQEPRYYDYIKIPDHNWGDTKPVMPSEPLPTF